ncbi:dGTP triphosphohydrolase [Hahella chejuensis KCTC 2396]|uniref:Deoxyguanosinetriphosphate triphosphohydrolase-like protein n=1 Tax=Hahella chejuensis (strain KCTC 2396) TaxID=349521 RepID=Q2S8I5_HAHCH|nr:dNTP triphosphohydrolase [Hahella chejuensis]ABC33039.1 dGTP triphosphohydrolase [Hahella chejuensis KCTC 2396]
MDSPLYNSSNKLYNVKNDCKRQDGRAYGNKERQEKSKLGRTPFQKDYARLLHSASFRRLQGKTQLYPGHEDDFFRNRLTHSLEVAQIAFGIAQYLNVRELPKKIGEQCQIDLDLVQFASLAHDIGHPPFGHNGEKALDELMRLYGGFEGNAQTLRILSNVEKKLLDLEDGTVDAPYGLNLTYRSLASILKYDEEISPLRKDAIEPRKGFYGVERNLVDQIKKHVAPGYTGENFKTIECSIMDVADDIAYSTYDLEDSFHAGFITPLYLLKSITIGDGAGIPPLKYKLFSEINKALKKEKYKELSDPDDIVNIVSDLFEVVEIKKYIDKSSDNNVADNVLCTLLTYMFDTKFTEQPLERVKFTARRVGKLIESVEFLPHENENYPQLSRVRLKREQLITVELLKKLNFMLTINSQRLSVFEFKGKEYIKQIFKSIIDSEGKLLPGPWKIDYDRARKRNISDAHRVVCDYVASMTDRQAAEFHGRLFSDGISIFKPLL